MSLKLCARGTELFAAATQADDVFKAKLVQFFSNTRRDDLEMMQIEVLGAQHGVGNTRRCRRLCD